MRHQAFTLIVTLVLAASAPVGLAEKIEYEPLSREARELGRLARYAGMDHREVSITLDDLTLKADVPVRARAYDAVPITYTLSGSPGGDERVAVEAVAFEEESRRKGRDLYDLAMPGDMSLRIEYLGSRTGVFDPSRVSRLTQASRHETFPPYALEPLVRSGTVRRGNYLFFKFRITNTGDTILDPEGFGGWMAVPDAHIIDAEGSRGRRFATINQYERHLEYVYPGESFEQWVSFWSPGQPPSHARTLPPGRFVIRYVAAYRDNREYDWIINMWGGRPWAGLEVDITVSDTAAQTDVETRELAIQPPVMDRMTRYVRSLEEFMTAFRVYEREELASARAGTLHLQVAPWTRQVVLKLIGTRPGRIRTVAVPIDVVGDDLAVRYNPDNPFVIERDGRREPLFCTQIMPAMRTTTQIGPEPDRHLRERYREAVELGVNAIATTAGNWHIPQVYDPNAFVGDIHAETFKYMYDVIAPELEVPVFGWGLFPSKTGNVKGLGEHVLGRPSRIPFVEHEGTTYAGGLELDVAHPDYPRLYAAAILFNYRRWGHLWYTTTDGDLLIDVEDSWGWLRDDINLRYILGEHAVRRFQRWLRGKYGSIEAVNRAWGTSYDRFDEIDPQKGHNDGGEVNGVSLAHVYPEYTNPDNPFHDWSPAVDDWDIFRTELRCDVYEEILKHVRREIPNAHINLRTEGAVIPVAVPADSDVAHIRHVHYSQRRNALISEVLRRRGVFKYHSDYTTIPYTESEWRMLLRKLREEGIRGNYLPQFCTARDMVLNDHYGRDFTIHYNLDAPQRAIMMHVLQAAFPVWRIMYEEGHVPGVLWEDYLCDGFVSETQKRELRLFRDALDRMMERAEASR